MTMLIHMECPSCGQALEIAKEGLGETVTCPTCGKEFKAQEERPAAVAVATAGKVTKWVGTESTAEVLCRFAGLCVVAAVLAGLAGFIGSAPSGLMLFAGAAFGGAVALFLFGQLYYIRAGLERIAEK